MAPNSAAAEDYFEAYEEEDDYLEDYDLEDYEEPDRHDPDREDPALPGPDELSLDEAAAPFIARFAPHLAPARTGEEELEAAIALIHPHHQAFLESKGIKLEVAARIGVRSVLKAEDLPESLRYRFKYGSGILFPNPRPDGEFDPQFRPDGPKDNYDGRILPTTLEIVKKYLFAEESGTGPWIDPEDTYASPFDTYLIVESAKGYMAALSWAPQGVHVIGIGGCSGGSKNHQLVPTWAACIPKHAKRVIICLDADIATNRHVHDAARTKEAYFKKVLKAKEVKFARLVLTEDQDREGTVRLDPKRGTDDVIGILPEDERTDYIAQLIEDAGPLPKLKLETGVVIDHEKGLMYYADTDEQGHSKQGRLLMNCAIRITRTWRTVNELNRFFQDRLRFDVEVTVPLDGGGTRTIIREGIPSEIIDHPMRWLDKVPGAEAVYLATRDRDEVMAAVRSQSGFERHIIQGHTGYTTHEDVPAFLDQGGAMLPIVPGMPGFSGARRIEGTVRASAADTLAAEFALLDVHAASEALKKADPAGREGVHISLEEVLDTYDGMKNPVGVAQALGAVGAAFSGVRQRGLLGYVGDPGCGKTVMSMWELSFFGLLGYLTFKSTKATIYRMGAGMHNIIGHVDDVKYLRTNGQAAVEAQNDAFGNLAERAYGGWEAIRVGQERDDTGVSFASTHRDRSYVHFTVSAEMKAIPWEQQSSMQRTFLVVMTPAHMDLPQAEAIKAQTKSGLTHLAGSWLAASLVTDAAEGNGPTGQAHGGPATLEAFLAAGEARFNAIVEELMNGPLAGKFDVSRAAEPLATSVLGIKVWARAMRRAAAVKGGESLGARIDAFERDAIERLTESALEWRQTVDTKSATPQGSVLAELKALVLSNKAQITSGPYGKGHMFQPGDNHAPVLGYNVTLRKPTREGVIILLEVAATMLHRKKEEILADLEPIVFRNGKGGPKITISPKLGGGYQPVIPLEVWENGLVSKEDLDELRAEEAAEEDEKRVAAEARRAEIEANKAANAARRAVPKPGTKVGGRTFMVNGKPVEECGERPGGPCDDTCGCDEF